MQIIETPKCSQSKTSKKVSPSTSKLARKTPDKGQNDSSLLSQLNTSSSSLCLSEQENALSFFLDAKTPYVGSMNVPPPPPESPVHSSIVNNNAKSIRLVSIFLISEFSNYFEFIGFLKNSIDSFVSRTFENQLK